MFENQTYQSILRRMLDKVGEWARGEGVTLDTREGSLIRTALSPAAFEIYQIYLELDQILNESFADTQSRDFLIRRCKERGIFAEPATFAIRRGEFDIPVPIGARFSLNRLNYAVIAPIENEEGAYRLQCETAGSIGNLESGTLIPIEYIEGLTLARLADVLIPGEDEEDTEHLRQRYFSSLNAQAYGGNIQDYAEKTLSLDGVGGVKVLPVWNGGGTVKLIIIDSRYKKPSQALIDAVQEAIDPVPYAGLGVGIAPIGHRVTVEGVTGEVIDIGLNLTLKEGFDWDTVKPLAEAAVTGYFDELAAGWDKTEWRINPLDTLVVRISQIETRLLGVAGILDVQNTLLNGTAANYTLGAYGIAVLGSVTNG